MSNHGLVFFKDGLDLNLHHKSKFVFMTGQRFAFSQVLGVVCSMSSDHCTEILQKNITPISSMIGGNREIYFHNVIASI